MRSEWEVNQAIDKYANLITRICFLYLKNEADTQDVLQSVFLKYLKHDKPFESEEHEKAWFIRVSINACKDILKNFFHSHIVSLDKVEQVFLTESPQHPEVLEAVLSLPQKYRSVIYLYYYEGYKETEIAMILKKKVNTIYTWMFQAKRLLKKQLGGEWDAS